MPNSATAYKQFTDQELLEQYSLYQNNVCLGILLERYTLLLLGVCLKYLKNEEDAKDAVQQIFTKTIAELGKYKVDHFKSWLYTVAKNHCFMQLRNKKYVLPEEQIDLRNNGLQELPEENIKRIEEKEQVLNSIEEALQSLQPAQKECVTLFYLEKKSYQEISETTGYHLLQVKSYIQNGKRNIRIMIEKKQAKHAS